MTFGDESTYAIPPRQGRVALLGLLKAVREEEGGHGTGATSLGEGARPRGLARQKSLAVVVSDFRGPRDWRRPLLDLAGRHDVVAVEVRDPREQELSNVGLLWLVDPETGRQLRVDTRSRNRERFAAAAAAERAQLAQAFASAGVRHVVLSTSGDWLRPLVAFLRRSRS